MNNEKYKLKVLILGATGRIGPGLIEEYKKKYSKNYELIIGVHSKNNDYGLEIRKYALNDLNSLKKAFEGMDVIVNMAGNSDPTAEFEDLTEPNINGAYNVFEAALQTGVKRVIYTSSVHAIKGNPIEYEIRSSDNPKALNFYGATKIFGEALCNVFASKGLSCIAIRVGAYVSNDLIKKVCFERSTYEYVITQRDFAQLLHKCIVADFDLKYAILAGISNNKKRNMDLKEAKEIVGYEPEDDVFEICEKAKQ